MTTCNVIINDFVHDRRSTFSVGTEEFDQVEKVWDQSDTVLAGLQENPLFAGRTTWGDLDPTHFRVMLMRNLTIVSELPEDDRLNVDTPAVRSLQFLICAMIVCLQQRAESHVELLRINRLGDVEVTFDYAACLNMAMDMPEAPKRGLTVIVDNTKKG